MLKGSSSVLIVADEPLEAKMALEVFQEPPAWETVWVQDGLAALDYLKRQGEQAQGQQPELIITDLRLPRLTGLQLLDKIKKHPDWARIPVVIWTVSLSEEDAQRAYALGAAGYFTKPLEHTKFLEKLRTIRAYWECAASPASRPNDPTL